MAEIALSSADADRSVSARVGDVLLVALESNATTGFEWAVDSTAGPISVGGDAYTVGDPSVGAGGIHRFRLTTTAPGDAAVTFKQWRPWQGDVSVREKLAFRFVVSN